MKTKPLMVLFAIIAIAVAYMWTQPEMSGGGFLETGTIMSISRVDFEESAPYLGGKSGWLLDFLDIPTGSNYLTTGYKTLSGDGQTSTQQIQIDSIMKNQECRFPIQGSSANPLYKYYIISEEGNKWVGIFGEPFCVGLPTLGDSNVVDSKCQNFATSYGGFVYYSDAVAPSGTYGCSATCVIAKQVGQEIPVLDGDVRTSVDFKITAKDGSTATTTISDDATFGDLKSSNNNVLGRVQLVGSLWSGRTCSSSVDVKNLWGYLASGSSSLQTSNGEWFRTWKSKYDSYRTTLNACSGLATTAAIKTCMLSRTDELNSALQNVQQSFPFYVYGDTKANLDILKYDNAGYFTTGNVNNLWKYPQFQMILSADWIKIGVYSSQPKILTTSSKCFSADDQGNIAVTIQNVGTGKGNFEIRASCGVGFTPTTTSTGLLEPNAQKTVYMVLKGSSGTQTQLNGNCQITAYDIADSSKTSTASVSVCVTQPKTCEAEFRCSPTKTNVVEYCAIGQWKELKTCPEYCVEGECRTTPIIPPVPVSEDFSKYIFTIIGFLVGAMLAIKYVPDKETYKPFYQRLIFRIAVLLGIIVALVFWMLYDPLLTAVGSIFPTFQCGALDVGCFAVNIMKLLLWIVVVIALLTLAKFKQ